MKTTNIGGTADILGNGDGTLVGTFRLRKGGNDRLQVQVEGVSGNDSTNTIITGSWIHVVFTSTGSLGTYNVYFNSVLDKTDSMSQYNLSDTSFLAVGARADNAAAKWEGDLDDIRFYNRVLTPQEVTDIYNYSEIPV